MLELLTPTVRTWFESAFDSPTHAQEITVPHIVRGESALLTSPTGSGKTLAGFLGAIDHLVRELEAGRLKNHVYALYVSPLRALTYDMERNLRRPLEEMGLADQIRIGLRTGDTPQSERQKFKRTAPHIFLTTPESLAILLPQTGNRERLRGTRFALIDELHALAENKRGAHLMASLERLEEISGTGEKPGLCRVGLSATVAPLDRVARFLVGPGRDCAICEGKAERTTHLEVLTPLRKDPYPPAGYTASRVIRDIADIVDQKRTTIIFCNTRSGAENISHRLKLQLPDLRDFIETHHSSIDRDLRLEVEDRLKHGELRAVVCSTSLELGIDIGSVDTVVMVSTPKGINRTLQRIGRSGHSVHRSSHGVLVATNINDLVECLVCARMAIAKQLDPVHPLEGPADVAAQQIVGMAMAGGTTRDETFDLLRRSYPFRDLRRPDLDRLIDYLMGGGRALEKQYTETFGKIVEDEEGRLITPSKKVERDYLVNVGTIHSTGAVRVYAGRRKIGEVEEGFVKGIKLGDIFVLAGRTFELVETGIAEIKVKEVKGRLPTVPAWNANKMPLASGLADEVTKLRAKLDEVLGEERPPPPSAIETAEDYLVENLHATATNAAATVAHFTNQLAISEIPTPDKGLIERYQPKPEDARRDGDDPDLIHFVFHTLIGRSANDALSRILTRRLSQKVGGNALVTIDDYGFLLTVKPFQDLEAEAWKDLFDPADAEADLDAALQGSELVKWQFRGVAQTGLMVPRNLPGKQRQLKQLRWSGEILFRVLEEHEPDHPVLAQAYREAKHTFLDTTAAIAFLEKAKSLPFRLIDVPFITPFAFGIYASKIKEGMMMESPDQAIERLAAELAKRT